MADSDQELKPVAEVLEVIGALLTRAGIVGVQGFSITARTDKSSLNLHWGDTRIRRRKAALKPTVRGEVGR